MESQKTLSYQVKKEGVQAGTKTHRGEDAQADPVGTPQRLLLHVAHILQRPERGRSTTWQRHMQSVRKTSKGGGGQRQRQRPRRYESESVQIRGHLKGGRGLVSGREREGEEESERETFRDKGCC